MKVAVFSVSGADRLGIIDGDHVVDLLAAAGETASGSEIFRDTIAFIRSGDEGRSRAEELVRSAPASARHELGSVKLRAPIMPTTILCSGSNYRTHNAEKAAAPTSGHEPEFFIKTSDCVIGPEEPIVYDERLTAKLDCETELAIVIGRPGRHIPVDKALDHVFGYTIVNDITARDRQVRRSPEGFTWYELGRGKAFDCSAPLGPVIVTADEVGDPQKLKLSTRVNGELRQHAETSDMIWSCAEIIHFFSVNFTLRPGMVIITGTPAGTAWSVDPELGGKWVPTEGLVPANRYFRPGDRVESEIEKIGVLRNEIK
jgi:2-keto-4-pentenoate hydratase/2-oxohepta-3-ene-1,7-dioic acid hydratase in catechol pathway